MLRELSRPISPVLRRQSSPSCRPFFHATAHRPVPALYPRTTHVAKVTAIAQFHSTPRREVLPLVPLMAGILKTSTALELTRTAGRIAMTFIPVILLKNYGSRKRIKHAALHGVPASEEKINKVLKRIRSRTWIINILFSVPLMLFWATIIASLERTPLTGRWRMIILSPEEEEDIASKLAGEGWYRAVEHILSQDGPPKYISPIDWRYTWVSETLRRLEATIPILLRESETCTNWADRGPNDPPLPPPAQYPLTSRPRASEFLHRMCLSICDKKYKPSHKSNNPPPATHSSTFAGPPYSLLLVDRPDAPNAFSYGFGPDGGGGVVVYSGFLDEIFSKYPIQREPPPVVKRSWWMQISRNLFSPSHPPPPKPNLTHEQTTELAVLLAHELSHLILSHHLESLSSDTVVVPGVLSIVSDVARLLIFPFTMLFGPFVNDAVAQLGKVGSGELTKLGSYCNSWRQEIEADIVSARLLAHAGFDAREAVKFWEGRSQIECTHETDREGRPVLGIRGDPYHPLNEARVAKFKEELQRWENEKQAVLAKRQLARTSDSP